MLVGKDDHSFGTVFQLYKETNSTETIFTSACNVFITFDQTKVVTERLAILYILYAYYATVPLTDNPFLAFFMEFVPAARPGARGNWIEQSFVCTILEGDMDKMEQLSPMDVFQHPEVYLAIHEPTLPLGKWVAFTYNVARLIDDPYIDEATMMADAIDTIEANKNDNLPSDATPDMILSYLSAPIQNQSYKLDNKVIKLLSDLLLQATTRTLTIPEYDVLIHGLKLHSNTVDLLPLAPKQLLNLIEVNTFWALDVVPMLLKGSTADAYLHFLAQPNITCNSLEVIHHVLTRHQQTLPGEFMHTYISNAIRTCDMVEGLSQERLVRMVAKFLQSLLEQHILPITDYRIEIKTFCLGFLKIRGVATLFRTVSHDV
ncbi:hypothetical protein BC941DRAFT_440023 [Chlamydoabsidia padenii]|nr:hypothetical protein BC941DRAFT_440023 [Chlamydoabsidia padenii]